MYFVVVEFTRVRLADDWVDGYGWVAGDAIGVKVAAHDPQLLRNFDLLLTLTPKEAIQLAVGLINLFDRAGQ